MDEDYQASSTSSQKYAKATAGNKASAKKSGKQHNTLPLWGNEATMNLNPLILANIQSSSYFKVHLFKLKTYHEVVDEIYYQVKHMEPWERGSRKTSGQTGMCGGVRGVGAGGIVSTAYCLLYKLYTLRLTRKQVNGLINHTDSPYIRALGFMYIRYTQPPADLYDWYEEYLQDEEEIEVKAGGGQILTIGQMVHQFLTKLEWFSTLFPRIPVPIQKNIERRIELYCRQNGISTYQLSIGASNANITSANTGSAVVGGSSGVGGSGSGGGGGGGVGTGRSSDGRRYEESDNGHGGNYSRYPSRGGDRYGRETSSSRHVGRSGSVGGSRVMPHDDYRMDYDERERERDSSRHRHHHGGSSRSSHRRDRPPTTSSNFRYSSSPESVYRGTSRERERYREKMSRRTYRNYGSQSRSRSRTRSHSHSRSTARRDRGGVDDHDRKHKDRRRR